MTDSAPNSLDEYNARQNRNNHFTGSGIDGTELHAACPFCASADFMVSKIMDTQATMTKGAVCRECGRGAKAIFRQETETTSFEIVQTCGPEQPDWLEPKMRRLA